MKPIVFTLIAMFCYAASNVLVELKFSKYNTMVLVSCFSGVVCLVALIILAFTKSGDPTAHFPTGHMILWMLGLGIIYTIADSFYMGAYTSGGGLVAITCISMMMPIFATGIKFFIADGPVPNLWHVAGYVLAACGLLCIVKGNMIPETLKTAT